jgi:hypothetical protein
MSQAVYDVTLSADWLKGNVSRQDPVKRSVGYAQLIQCRGVCIGDRSQFEELDLQADIEERNMMNAKRPGLAFPDGVYRSSRT